MNCALNKNQEEAVSKLMGKIIKSDVRTPEQIIKGVYDTMYEAFVTKKMTDKAADFAFAAAEYAAQNLKLVSKMNQSEVRDVMMALSGNKDAFSEENLDRLTKVDEIRKVLNLDKPQPNVVASNVSKDQVKAFLETIKKSFPQTTEKKKFSNEKGNLEWDFTLLKDKEGNPMKVTEVTRFLKGQVPLQQSSGLNISNNIRAGNITDYVVRKFFSQRKSFRDLEESLLADNNFLDMFMAYTANNSKPEMGYVDSLMLDYASKFIKDMTYTLSFIQDKYKNYYITDLTELLEKSDLPKEEKDRFFIYSEQIGLRGELDLLAIAPDGTYRVLDIKTSSTQMDEAKIDNYAKQTSLYDLIIQKASHVLCAYHLKNQQLSL